MGNVAAESKSDRRGFWQRAIDRWQSSGLSVHRFCEQEGLSTASFYGWRRRFGNEAVAEKLQEREVPAFVEVSLPVSRGSALELVLSSGNVLRIYPDINREVLDRVLLSLREAHLC